MITEYKMDWLTKAARYAVMAALLTINFSCTDLVEVDPPTTSINSGNVFASDATAIAAVTDMYVKISRAELPSIGIASLNLFPGLSSDELSLYNGATNNSVNFYYTNALTSTNLGGTDFWSAFYHTIYVSNAAIEGVSESSTLTPAVKDQLLGEAKFMRAFCYFYLVNLYGDIPLATTTDYQVNSTLSRLPEEEVYERIITDLKAAQNLLAENYLDATLLSTTAERVRPTQWAATALLARAYLYSDDFESAEAEATKVIDHTTLFELVSLEDSFLKNNREAIWQLQPVNAGWNTESARTFILPSNGPDAGSHSFYLSPQVLASFEPGDERNLQWVGSVTAGSDTYYYPFKYKSATYNNPVTEYETVLRLGELYLVRAEARAHLNNISGAQNDLNVIRNRAGLPNTALSEAEAINAILQERQVELFTEWGHRWFDLKRTNSVDAVMSVVASLKGGVWSSNWQWYPISQNELQLNPVLYQNTGY